MALVMCDKVDFKASAITRIQTFHNDKGTIYQVDITVLKACCKIIKLQVHEKNLIELK